MTPIQGRWLLGKIQFRKSDIMTEHSLWRFSRAMHSAINERQPKDLEALIDEDVDWAIYGPIDMFPFFGARRGKAAVLEVVRQIADNVRVHRFDRESIMLGVDSAASMMRYSLTSLDFDKPISLGLPISRNFGPAGCAASACSSIPSIWWSRRSGAPFICRGSRRRDAARLKTVIASAAKQSITFIPERKNGLLRRFAPRNDGKDGFLPPQFCADVHASSAMGHAGGVMTSRTGSVGRGCCWRQASA